MKVTSIYIYPVKSMPGIPLQEARALDKGFQDDRRWMIVDSENQFITQREFPKLTLAQLQIDSDELRFTSNGSEVIFEKEYSGAATRVQVWNDQVTANESDPRAGEWLSDFLGTNCRLVKMEESRMVRKKLDKQVSFADGYPYLFLGEASMNDLNSRLDQELSILRFRPNLVFDGGTPFEEDDWKMFHVGDLKFRGVKPCVRCVMTTIDPVTSEQAAEPLKTLSTYRRNENGVIFGLNAFAEEEGIISVGDSIAINKAEKNG